MTAETEKNLVTVYDLFLELINTLLNCEEKRKAASSKELELEVPPDRTLYSKIIRLAKKIENKISPSLVFVPLECPSCHAHCDFLLLSAGRLKEDCYPAKCGNCGDVFYLAPNVPQMASQ